MALVDGGGDEGPVALYRHENILKLFISETTRQILK